MENPDVIRRLEKLSPRKKEILKCFCRAMSIEQIAEKYCIEKNSVRSHMSQIYIKLELDLISVDARRAVLLRLYCEAFEKYVKGSEYKGETAIVDLSPESFEEEAKEEEDMTPKSQKRKKEIDRMIDSDQKAIVERRENKGVIPVPVETRRRINPFQIGLFIFALIGFAAVSIFIFELLTGRLGIFSTNQQEPAPIQEIQQAPTEMIVPTALPTNTEIVPTQSLTSAPTPLPKPAVLFEDDFENGLSDAWEVVSGNPMIVNGMLTSDQDTWLMVGDPNWRNYSVEFVTEHPLPLYGYSTGFNAIGMRVQDIDNMYAFKWGRYQGESYIVQSGNWSKIPQSDYDVDDDETNLRFTMVDGTMTVYENGVKGTSFFDTRFENGKIALKIFPEAIIDNFKVKEILE